ncbi:MAG: FCD domain-containing protein [Coprococcus phoceensis]
MKKIFFAEQYTVDRQHFAESQKMHREIVTAIENQDMDMAYRKMQEHIIQTRFALDLDSIRRTEK